MKWKETRKSSHLVLECRPRTRDPVKSKVAVVRSFENPKEKSFEAAIVHLGPLTS